MFCLPGKSEENELQNIKTYGAGSDDRAHLLQEINRIKKETVEIPLIIHGEEVFTGNTMDIVCPHHKDMVLAKAHLAGEKELKDAMDAALTAHRQWREMDFYHRGAIFRRVADMLTVSHRYRNIAAIMLNQSKNPYEAEIDLIELVDFLRFNTVFMEEIYSRQPNQYRGEMNRFDWRPLEGFVLAIPPFNFYSISGNLPTAPAMMGNTALWKPARSVIFANYEIMKLLITAGLPKGVINFVPFSSKIADIVLKDPNLAGLHFTGSYDTLTTIWKEIGNNVRNYNTFPRIVGETGGKDFIVVHCSADPKNTAMSIIGGGFGYQGQKCSAASRVYIPECQWLEITRILLDELPHVTYGETEDFRNYMGALIDEKAFDKVVGYIEYAKANPEEYEIVYGGNYDSSEGWFVEPTIIKTTNPKGKLMTEEIFGPVVTVYLYENEKYEETLKLCNATSPYGLTGSIFARDREAITLAEKVLRFSAGNFYINDKPTGAVVARQPFGGARNSGTNDKAGSILNMLRWVSPRAIKETTQFANDWRKEFMF